MPSATFTAYAPVGASLTGTYGYSQALVLHPAGFVKLSGQGGWHPTLPLSLAPSAEEQVRLAFDNVALALEAAGVKDGWASVINVRSYHTDLGQSFELVSEELKRRAPHQPLWTCVGVTRLALEEMQLEIEVEALIKEQ
ncbi:hypothetical protein JCM10449v2_001688 [Rhodotorula kratochvilovae]